MIKVTIEKERWGIAKTVETNSKEFHNLGAYMYCSLEGRDDPSREKGNEAFKVGLKEVQKSQKESYVFGDKWVSYDLFKYPSVNVCFFRKKLIVNNYGNKWDVLESADWEKLERKWLNNIQLTKMRRE